MRTIIAMSHDLGYRVVAEGIETEAARDMLAAWQCDEGQGYLLARPMQPAAFAEWFRGQGDAGLRQAS